MSTHVENSRLADPFGWVGHVLDGRYRVDEVIGHGGFGVVYRAHHLALAGPVAIKFLDLRTLVDPVRQHAFLRAFQAEGRILHQLSSRAPAIVRALDLSAATSPRHIWTPYLVLEWLQGRTLHDYLHERQRAGRGFALDELLHLLAPVAAALEVAHMSGVAHRDVKPGNIFLLDDGSTKILDFGIAKILSDDTIVGERYNQTGESLQAFSSAYGAPEQFEPGAKGLGATGPWTDVYALALIVVEMLCGRRAYDGSTASHFHIQATNRSERPTPLARGVPVTPEVEQVLRQALAVDPRNRQTSAGVFFRALGAAREQAPRAPGPPATMTPDMLPVRAPSDPPPAPPPTTTSNAHSAFALTRRTSHRAGFIFAGGAIAVLLAFGAAYALTRSVEGTEAASKGAGPKAAGKAAKPPGPPARRAIEKNGTWTDHLNDEKCGTCSAGAACESAPSTHQKCASGFTCVPGVKNSWLEADENEKWYLHLSGVAPTGGADGCLDSVIRKARVCFEPAMRSARGCIDVRDACAEAETGWSQTSIRVRSSDFTSEGMNIFLKSADGSVIARRLSAKHNRLYRRAVCSGIKFGVHDNDGTEIAEVSFFITPRK